MRRSQIIGWAIALLLLLASVGQAAIDTRKLDPRARITLARFTAGVPVAALRASGMAVNEQGELDVFIRGPVSRQELEAKGARVRTALPGLYTASVPLAALEGLAALPGVASIGGATPVELQLDASVPTTGATAQRGSGPNFTGLNGAGVLVGAVDSGVDYGHGDFDDAAGNTRLVSIWDQTVVGIPPAGFAYGSEWSTAQIDANLCPEADGGAHGTHVLGIAGGDGSQTGGSTPAYTYVGMAPRADLVMVKTDFMTTHIVDGVKYVFDRATARGENAVCNLSIGRQFGPHDGSSDFEAGLSALAGPGRIVTVSAGNYRAAPIHAETMAAGAGSPVTLSVSGSATNRTFAIDGYYNSTENIDVKITGPGGAVIIGPISRGSMNATYPGQATAVGTIYIENGASTTARGDYQVYVEVTAASGENMDGSWTFTYIPVSLGASNGQVDLWDFFSSNGLSTSFVTGLSARKLVAEPGNALHVVTAASYSTKRFWINCEGNSQSNTLQVDPGNLSPFSSPGPTRDGRQKPDIAAPGAAIGSTLSLDAGLTCPDINGELLNDGPNHLILSGTSMAAPHTAGAAALLMQKYGSVTPAYILNQLIVHAKTDGSTGAVWNRDWGYGKLFIGTASDPLVQIKSPEGGEIGAIGRTMPLQWTASSPALAAGAEAVSAVTSVDLKLSRDGGQTYETIATGVSNTGDYLWTVTGPVTSDAFLSVVAHDGSGNVGTDLSTNAFTIQTAPTGVEGGGGTEFALGRGRPNPTGGRADFEFFVPREGAIKLVVTDLMGRRVATLAEGVYRPGRYTASWNGRSGGRRAPAGLYFIHYQTSGESRVQRIVLEH